jgi:hypothetical protein
VAIYSVPCEKRPSHAPGVWYNLPSLFFLSMEKTWRADIHAEANTGAAICGVGGVQVVGSLRMMRAHDQVVTLKSESLLYTNIYVHLCISITHICCGRGLPCNDVIPIRSPEGPDICTSFPKLCTTFLSWREALTIFAFGIRRCHATVNDGCSMGSAPATGCN